MAKRRDAMPPALRNLRAARPADQSSAGQADTPLPGSTGAASAPTEVRPDSSAAHLTRLGLAEPLPVVSALKQGFEKFCAAVDVTSAFMLFNNDVLLKQLRQPVLQGSAGQASVSLTQLHEQVSDFQRLLKAAPAGSKQDQMARKQVDKLLADVVKNTHNLLHGTGASQRIATVLASLVLYPLPFLTAQFQHEEQYLTLICAAYAKTAAMAIGYVRNDTSDLKLFIHHLKGRHSVFLYPALAYTIPAFVKAAHHLQTNIPYGIGAGIFTAGALVATFYSKEVTALHHRIMKTMEDGGNLPEAVQAGALGLLATIPENQQGMAQMRARVENQVGPISDPFSTVLSFHNEALSALETALKKGLTSEHRARLEDAAPIAQAGSAANKHPDLAKKLAFALTAAIVTFTVAALSFPELLGTVDLGIDAVFVTTLMFLMAQNKSKTPQDILTEFKTFAGLSLAALAFTSANKATGFLEKDGGFVPGVVGITSTNLLLSGPLASTVAKALLMVSAGASQAVHYLRTAGGEQLAATDIELANGPRIVELPDDEPAVTSNHQLPDLNLGSDLSKDIGSAFDIGVDGRAAPNISPGQLQPAVISPGANLPSAMV